MDGYRKGKNEEEELDKAQIQIPNLPEDFIWMQVKGGSKIRNLLEYAIRNIPSTRTVVWTGIGPSVGKAITCAEIMKRDHQQRLHQITKICYRYVNEYWDPVQPELDQLVVKRKLPMIHICLSMDKFDGVDTGYQAPGDIVPYKGQQNPHRKPANSKNYNKNSHFVKNQGNTSGR